MYSSHKDGGVKMPCFRGRMRCRKAQWWKMKTWKWKWAELIPFKSAEVNKGYTFIYFPLMATFGNRCLAKLKCWSSLVSWWSKVKLVCKVVLLSNFMHHNLILLCLIKHKRSLFRALCFVASVMLWKNKVQFILKLCVQYFYFLEVIAKLIIYIFFNVKLAAGL